MGQLLSRQARLLEQVGKAIGAGRGGCWSRWKRLPVQVEAVAGAGGKKMVGPAPLERAGTRSAVQVPHQKSHLRQDWVSPSPRPGLSCTDGIGTGPGACPRRAGSRPLPYGLTPHLFRYPLRYPDRPFRAAGRRYPVQGRNSGRAVEWRCGKNDRHKGAGGLFSPEATPGEGS